MATAQEVINFIQNKYTCSDTDFGALRFQFDLPEGRSQLVFAWINDTNIQVSSPFATTAKVTPLAALEAASKKTLGIQLLGDLYTACYYAPLADIDASEIESAIVLTTLVADSLEQELLGTDDH